MTVYKPRKSILGKNSHIALVFLWLCHAVTFAQDTVAIEEAEVLHPFFQKVEALQKGELNTLRIVHIGDSHIQADFFTQEIREELQDSLGNAGLGYSFPYRLAKTNGDKSIAYASNVKWTSRRNIFCSDEAPVGVSGYLFQTTNPNFVLQIVPEDKKATTLTLFSPDLEDLVLATAKPSYAFKEIRIKNRIHRIRSGETLSGIAQDYGVSVSAIKRANGLRSSMIRAGARLKIPQKVKEPLPIDWDEFTVLHPVDSLPGVYHFPQGIPETLYVLPKHKAEVYTLSGIAVERSQPGVVYSNIGVNGGRFSDYTKFPLFFRQLKGLQPDLIVVSLGTNESFDKMDTAEFATSKQAFIAALRREIPDVPLLLTTPPPSRFNRRTANTYAAQFAQQMVNRAADDGYAVWDLYQALGSNDAISTNIKQHLMAYDRVHYTVKGYTLSGERFMQAFWAAFNHYQELNQLAN